MLIAGKARKIIKALAEGLLRTFSYGGYCTGSRCFLHTNFSKKMMTIPFLQNVGSFMLLMGVVACTSSQISMENDLPSGDIPVSERDLMGLTDSALVKGVQKATFNYFWDFAHPASGMAPERTSTPDTVTVGGSGFGVMALVVGVERGFISREEGVERLLKIVHFLQDKADRFHGAWPHWMNGETGKVVSFSPKDNGADLVETAFMIQGLLTVRQYFDRDNAQEKALRDIITQLWKEVEWDWFTRGGQNVLYWHWSPTGAWAMNMPIRGYNEALIVYVLAASSPTHPVKPAVYHQGWTNTDHFKNGKTYYTYELPLGFPYGGPLFFTHYSFLGLDPRGLKDQYADYWQQNTHHTLINHAYCIDNPKHFEGYSDQCWGLTASDNPSGYGAQAPGDADNGTITPTAAISSIPYAPEIGMKAMRYFYDSLGDQLWGAYGFHDAFNLGKNWFSDQYLAIDQGPMVVMLENYRTGLLWDNFMKNEEIINGLKRLGFQINRSGNTKKL